MGRKKSRRSRSVYDPSISAGSDASVSNSSLGQMDPLALEAHIEDEIYDIRHARGTAVPRMKQKRKCTYVFTVPLLMMAIVVVAILGGRAVKSSSTHMMPFSMTGLATGDPDYVLPQPSPNLGDFCTEKAVAKTNGRMKCEQLCEVSECCTFPANIDTSCIQYNSGTCANYAKYCKVLGKTGGATAAQTDEPAADTTEVDDGIGGGSATATTTKTPIAATTTKDSANSDKAPLDLDLQANLEVLCANDDLESCLDACSPALCCFPPQSLRNGGACDASAINCENYKVCEDAL